MSDDLETRAIELASWPVQVAILDEDKKVVGSAVLPADTAVIIGSDAGVTVPLTGRADIARVDVSETRDDGVWIHVADDAAIHAVVICDGAEIELRGKLADARTDHPTLASPIRILSPKTIIRVGPVAVVLHRDPSF